MIGFVLGEIEYRSVRRIEYGKIQTSSLAGIEVKVKKKILRCGEQSTLSIQLPNHLIN